MKKWEREKERQAFTRPEFTLGPILRLVKKSPRVWCMRHENQSVELKARNSICSSFDYEIFHCPLFDQEMSLCLFLSMCLVCSRSFCCVYLFCCRRFGTNSFTPCNSSAFRIRGKRVSLFFAPSTRRSVVVPPLTQRTNL